MNRFSVQQFLLVAACLTGIVSVDDANQRVILTLGPVASGTLIMLR